MSSAVDEQRGGGVSMEIDEDKDFGWDEEDHENLNLNLLPRPHLPGYSCSNESNVDPMDYYKYYQ
jgi:hypothetical protein